MDNTNLIKFPQKLAKILESLEIKQNDGDELIKKLSSAYMVNFSRLMSSDEKIAPYLKDFSSAADSSPDKLLGYLDSKNVNYQEVLVSAQKETLQSFVNELTSDLTSEKIEEINKIILE
jgi:hypothetical protein